MSLWAPSYSGRALRGRSGGGALIPRSDSGTEGPRGEVAQDRPEVMAGRDRTARVQRTRRSRPPPVLQTFTSVGYGAYEVARGPGGHAYLYDDVRMRATGALNAVNPARLRISMNPATGQRRHLLRRLRWTQLPRRHRHRRRYHHHRRRDLPRDERRLPAGHRTGTDISEPVRHLSLNPVGPHALPAAVGDLDQGRLSRCRPRIAATDPARMIALVRHGGSAAGAGTSGPGIARRRSRCL